MTLVTSEQRKKEEDSMEKTKIDGKMKSVASIPASYVSILQLQERWMREKERKQKKGGLVEREVKQQVNGQRRREEEEDVTKVVEATMEPRVKLEEKGLSGGFLSHCGVNRWTKEPNCIEKEELEEVSATVSKKEEDGGEGDSREEKKKNVKEMVKCESKVSPAYIPREENNNPAKEKDSTVEETQFQDLLIKKKEERLRDLRD